MTYQEGLARLEGRGKLATIVLWLFAAMAPFTAGSELLEATGVVNIEVDEGPLAAAIGVTYLGFTAVFILSIVLVAMWLHRAHANLHEGSVEGLEFTPNWAVGWYFVPIANLFMPFKAMRELWNASHGKHDFFGSPAPTLVRAWWAAWIVGNVVDTIGTRILLLEGGDADSLAVGNGLAAAGTVATMIAAILLIRIIGAVTRAQRGGASAAATFA